jgi:hypothetical protein
VPLLFRRRKPLPGKIENNGIAFLETSTRYFRIAARISSRSVWFVKNEGEDAIEAQLGSHFATVGTQRLIGKGAINVVTGRVLFDRLQNDNGTMKSRVADFNVKI